MTSNESRCPACNGNDGDAPCAYPSEGRAGCLRESRMAFEVWATSIGLMKVVFGILGINSQTDIAQKAWQAAESRMQAKIDAAVLAEREPRPIETAPKDGTRIMVIYGRASGFPVQVVFFDKFKGFWSHYGKPELGLESNATHWLPIILPKSLCTEERPCIPCYSDNGDCLGPTNKE